MAMPISNTHLRVPRGFGALLEDLTREILRDQPKDIPKYATEYFETLLKQREENGTDPIEWAAKLEDRYYNNHSFETSNRASRTTVSNKHTEDSAAEDDSGQSEEPNTKRLTTSEEEKRSPAPARAESAEGPPIASPDTTASTKAPGQSHEINNGAASNQNDSESEGHEEELSGATENASESDAGGEDDDREDEAGDVNICTTYSEDETAVEEEPEQKVGSESGDMRAQSPVSQMEMTNEQEDQAGNDAKGGTASDDNEESSDDKSLVEISFEDVPENQQNVNNELRMNKEIVEMTATITNEQEDDDDEGKVSNRDRSEEESVDVTDTEHRSKAENLLDEDSNNVDDEENSSVTDNFEKPHATEDATAVTEDGETGDRRERELRKSVDDDAAGDLTQQLTDSNVKLLEGHGEIVEQGDGDLSEEDDQYQEETLEKYFTLSQDQQSEAEELVDEGLSDREVEEGHSAHDEDNVNLDLEEWTDKEDTGLQEEQQDMPDPETNDEQEECSRPQEEEDIMDIPLDDPEANRAAAKIQAGFRGHMTRKKMKPEDKTEGEEVSSSGDVPNGCRGGTETGGSRPVGSNDTSVPEQ